MSILNDSSLFVAILQQGGFSHAAKHLGLSNGLISRRIAKLEATLGVTLIKRTTRQLNLTPEGELFLQHAKRIQQELDTAVSLIQSSAHKPKGTIRISAPTYFGRRYLSPIITRFLSHFDAIKIDLLLSNQKFDLLKENLDLVIRGSGYSTSHFEDSSMKMKLLVQKKIGLYASPNYLARFGEPKSVDDLPNHKIMICSNPLQSTNDDKWNYSFKNQTNSISLDTNFSCDDIESVLNACIEGCGIGKFTEMNVEKALPQQIIKPVLTQYDWGTYQLYAIYSNQHALPQRTRLLLDFIQAHLDRTNSKFSA